MTFARTYTRPERTFPSAAQLGQRRAVMAVVADTPAPQPKTVPQRNPHLLAMAEGKPCLLLVKEICKDDRTTTVSAHSNYLFHGKARGRKADDHYSVWACARCHNWLDGSYNAEFLEKRNAFMEAHLRQVLAWRQIAANGTDKDWRAAQWALDRLNATTVGAYK